MVGLPSYAPIPSPRPQAEGGAFGSLGGLGSGLAGFVNSPQGGDVLSAIGMSLLSSPRNAPMQALPQLLGGLQQQRFQQQKYDEALKEQERKQLEAQQEREALVVAAKSAGLSEEEARSLAINPTALKMRLDQVQTERANNERNQFMQGLPSLYGEPAQPVQQPANDASQDSWGALAQEYGWAVPGGEPDTFQIAQTQPQAQPVQPASRNAENLMRMREQEIHRLYAAPDERTRKVIEGRIGQIDKRLELEGQTDTQKNLEYRAEQAGFVRGSPEWRDFMARGGNMPAQTNITNVVGGEQLTPGWKKIDEAFADTYLGWNSGGYADSKKQISQLTESLDIIEGAAKNGQNISGIIGTLPNAVQPFINPQGTIAREGVEEVVQRSLREILGAQFTEKEGERLIARAYNPSLPPAENAKRVRRLLGTIEKMGEAKQKMVDYFDENGTLRGFKGERPSAAQIDRLSNEFGEAPEEDSSQGGAPTIRPRAVNPSTGQAIEYDGTRWVPVQ